MVKYVLKVKKTSCGIFVKGFYKNGRRVENFAFKGWDIKYLSANLEIFYRQGINILVEGVYGKELQTYLTTYAQTTCKGSDDAVAKLNFALKTYVFKK